MVARLAESSGRFSGFDGLSLNMPKPRRTARSTRSDFVMIFASPTACQNRDQQFRMRVAGLTSK